MATITSVYSRSRFGKESKTLQNMGKVHFYKEDDPLNDETDLYFGAPTQDFIVDGNDLTIIDRITKLGGEKACNYNTEDITDWRFENNCIFAGKDIEEIKIPLSVKQIGDYCFNECKKLKRVYIPISVTKIGIRAFSGCGSFEQPLELCYQGDIENWYKVLKNTHDTAFLNSWFGLPGEADYIDDFLITEYAFMNLPIPTINTY